MAGAQAKRRPTWKLRVHRTDVTCSSKFRSLNKKCSLISRNLLSTTAMHDSAPIACSIYDLRLGSFKAIKREARVRTCSSSRRLIELPNQCILLHISELGCRVADDSTNSAIKTRCPQIAYSTEPVFASPSSHLTWQTMSANRALKVYRRTTHCIQAWMLRQCLSNHGHGTKCHPDKMPL